MFALVIHEKGGAERREMFEGTEISVGRVQGNELMLPKGNVSKRHARLLYRDGRFIVTDLNSTNGTYVNRRRITQATIVREGDRIYIGDFILRIEPSSGGIEASAAVPLPSVPPVQRQPLPTVGDSQPGSTVTNRPSLDEEEELTRAPVKAAPVRSSPAAAPEAPLLTPPGRVTAGEEEPALKSAILDAVGLLVERVARALHLDELEADVSPELAAKIDELLREHWSSLASERLIAANLPAERVLATARSELVELGPLGELLSDPSVTEVAIVGPERITVSRSGRATLCENCFSCALALRWALARLCARSSAPLAEATLVERRFADGTSLTATLSPGSSPVALLVRPRRLSGTLDDLVRRGTASRALATFLQQCLLARLNLLIVGPRDGGVELLLGAFAASLAESEVVYAGNLAPDRPAAGAAEGVSLEGAEAIALAARAPYLRLFAELSSQSVTEAIVGAACDGADGLVIARSSTSLDKALLRISSELRPAYGEGAMELVAGAFEIVVEVARLRDGRHRVLRVAEVLGAHANELQLSDVFSFSIDRTAAGGLIEGSFAPASNMPAVADLMRTRGAPIDSALFTRPSSR